MQEKESIKFLHSTEHKDNKKDKEDLANERIVPSHSEAFVFLDIHMLAGL